MSLETADSQPEPDLAVVHGPAVRYRDRYPTSADAGLVVEVADSSLLRDRRDKTRIYARAGIAVYWVVNLVDRRAEVYTRPSGPADAPAYGDCRTFGPGDHVPLELEGVAVGAVAVDDLIV